MLAAIGAAVVALVGGRALMPASFGSHAAQYQPAPDTDWPTTRGDAFGTRYSPLAQITTDEYP